MRATPILVLFMLGCGGRSAAPPPTPPPAPPTPVAADPPAADPPEPAPAPPEIIAECHTAMDIGPTCIDHKRGSGAPLPEGHPIPACYSAMNIYDVCIERRTPLRLPEDPDLVPGDDAR